MKIKHILIISIIFIRVLEVLCLAPPLFIEHNELLDKMFWLEKRIPFHEIIRFQRQKRPDEPKSYWLNQADLREFIYKCLEKKEYRTVAQFENMFLEMRNIAKRGKSGRSFYKGVRQIETFRFTQAFSMDHPTETGEVLFLLEELKRKFGVEDPFTVSKKELVLNLDRVPVEARPVNCGIKHAPTNMHYKDAYFTALHNIFLEIIDLMENNYKSEEVVKKIAEFHQYVVAFHPFEEVNNSIFMNLVNVLLNENGWKGMSHGILDYAAMRVSPENYALLFVDAVVNKEDPIYKDPPLQDPSLIMDAQIRTLIAEREVKGYIKNKETVTFKFKVIPDYRFEYKIEAYSGTEMVGYILVKENGIETATSIEFMYIKREWMVNELQSKLIELVLGITKEYLQLDRFFVYSPSTDRLLYINPEIFKEWGFKPVTPEFDELLVYTFNQQEPTSTGKIMVDAVGAGSISPCL